MSDLVNLYAPSLISPGGDSFAVSTTTYVENNHQQQKDRSLIGADGQSTVISCIRRFEEQPDYVERLTKLIETVYEKSLRQIVNELPMPVWLLLPIWMKESETFATLMKKLERTPMVSVAPIRALFGEHAEGLIAIAECARSVGDGEHPAVMLIAADSHIHPDLLDRLAVEKRIRSKLQPHGMVPGEAAAALVIGNARHMNDVKPMGFMTGIKSNREDENLRNPVGLIGKALAEDFRFTTKTLAPNRLMVDLNGERYRAEEFGYAVASSSPALADLAANPETPAFLFGDMGAATGLFLAALALGPRPAFAAAFRQSGGPDRTLISTSSYHTGRRAVAVIERTSYDPEGC
ncbi:hypothetical protein [Rhizobium skierniewicense]|uniref:hypothetical protein n=1 Tax=Rhizobium skierniewicense TaxID=984260 RepID=UPI0015742D08|nr:hypothetical protein [Rhizobium skierniewicense]NTF34806.1 hypothetical protein [Rhizobium skierniewicense]